MRVSDYPNVCVLSGNAPLRTQAPAEGGRWFFSNMILTTPCDRSDNPSMDGWMSTGRYLLIFFKFHEESDISHGEVGPSNVGQREISLLITTCYLNEMDIAILLSAIF